VYNRLEIKLGLF